MLKIIGGRKYNTETAKAVGEHWNERPVGDFGYIYETLYRKTNGEFFLHGKGGPATSYAETHGDLRSGGEKIRPLTFRAAQEWAEMYLDAEDYEKLFGEVLEAGEKRACTFSLSEGVVEIAKREAARTGENVSDVVARAIINTFGV